MSNQFQALGEAQARERGGSCHAYGYITLATWSLFSEHIFLGLDRAPCCCGARPASWVLRPGAFGLNAADIMRSVPQPRPPCKLSTSQLYLAGLCASLPPRKIASGSHNASDQGRPSNANKILANVVAQAQHGSANGTSWRLRSSGGSARCTAVHSPHPEGAVRGPGIRSAIILMRSSTPNQAAQQRFERREWQTECLGFLVICTLKRIRQCPFRSAKFQKISGPPKGLTQSSGL